MAKFLFVCLLIAIALYLCGTQPMSEGDINRLRSGRNTS